MTKSNVKFRGHHKRNLQGGMPVKLGRGELYRLSAAQWGYAALLNLDCENLSPKFWKRDNQGPEE